jgi:hypothetical protein
MKRIIKYLIWSIIFVFLICLHYIFPKLELTYNDGVLFMEVYFVLLTLITEGEKNR